METVQRSETATGQGGDTEIRTGSGPWRPRWSVTPRGAGGLVAPVPGRARWEVRYALRAAAVDVLALTLAILGYAAWGSADPASLLFVALTAVTVLLAGAGLAAARAWDTSVLGQGSEEYGRLLRAWVTALVVLALAGLALQIPEMRPWVFGVVPAAACLSAVGRFALRKSLHRRRYAGRCMQPVLAVGTDAAVAQLVERTRRAAYHGWEVTAACTPDGGSGSGPDGITGVPVVGDLDSVASLAASGRFRVVSLSHTPSWTPRRLHQLSWDLEGSGVELVVDPGLMEVAGPRLHVASVDGLPLLRLSEPRFTGFPRVVKTAIDRLGAAAILLLTAPLMLAVVLAVRWDGGPAFFRQTRVGLGGREFTMVKFRSMVVDAEKLRADLVASDEGAGPLFKMRADPRVTRLGAFLRRYSLDELPQLFNVLAGSMSLVGPRPPLPVEVAGYAPHVARRLLVRPGLTGLWQVSGRSDLSWEESVRLDLRYVENWTLALDSLILWKTIGAVLRPNGAY